MSAVFTNFSCERCGQEAGKILGCSERDSGICPFVKQWKRKRDELLVIGIALTFLLFFLLETWKIQFWAFIPFASIVIWSLSQEVQFYNAKLHARLLHLSVAGVELGHKWTTRGRLLPIHLEPYPSIAYPLSITALAPPSTQFRVSTEQATAVFRAALIDLLAKECVEIYHFHSYIFRAWRRSPSGVEDYIIVAKENVKLAQGAGALEHRIMRAIAGWSAQAGKKEWTDGPPIEELVRAVYESNHTHDSRWLAKLVAEDAVARGLGVIEGAFFWKKIDWAAAHFRQVRQEQKLTRALSQRLAKADPEFSRTLDQKISTTIHSMEREATG